MKTNEKTTKRDENGREEKEAKVRQNDENSKRTRKRRVGASLAQSRNRSLADSLRRGAGSPVRRKVPSSPNQCFASNSEIENESLLTMRKREWFDSKQTRHVGNKKII